MTTCIIIDDEQHAIDLLSDHIRKFPSLRLQYATDNSVDAYQYLQQHSADLIFLDIQMPHLDGIQLLKLLKGKSKVILTTAYPEYAMDGYEHDVIDYLLKPIVFDRFLKAVQKAMDVPGIAKINPAIESTQSNAEAFIFVKRMEGERW